MKKILSIISAGVLAVLAVSCAKDDKVTFGDADLTAPVLGNYTVGSDIVASFTPAEYKADFNAKLPVNHTLALVSVDGTPVSKVLSSKAEEDKLTVTGKNLTATLQALGFEIGQSVQLEIVVRATLQDLSKDNGINGYVDSEGKIATNWTLKEDVKPGGGNARPATEGYALFVDATGSTLYNEAIALYAWGDGLSDADDLFGGWPGMQPTGTVVLDGVTYFYFDLGAKTEGKVVNFIINNNGGGSQLENFDVLKGQTIDHDFFFKITDDTVETVEVTFGGGGNARPSLEGFGFFVDATESTLYNEAIALYAWGDGLSDATDLFGGWPGMQPTGTAELDGVTYFYFDLGAKTEGKVVNFIINNNGGGSQLENFDVLKGQTIDHDFFFKITDDTVETVEVTFGGGGSSLPDIDLSGFAEISACAGAEVWSVIGNAVGGWEEANDVNLEKVSDDPEIWTVSGLELPADKFKFRGNHTWADWDLGGGTWAVGTPIALTKGGGDMMAEAGTYTFWLYPTYGVLYIEAE